MIRVQIQTYRNQGVEQNMKINEKPTQNHLRAARNWDQFVAAALAKAKARTVRPPKTTEYIRTFN